jgi:hypothetical protein
MAHELEFVNGVAQMAYRESAGIPWHGLGVPVSDDMTPQEMMKAAGLDWTVKLQDAFIEVNGEKVPTGQQALVRENGTLAKMQKPLTFLPTLSKQVIWSWIRQARLRTVKLSLLLLTSATALNCLAETRLKVTSCFLTLILTVALLTSSLL